MKIMATDDFLNWAADVGIGFDAEYPESGCLKLLQSEQHARFWVLPPDPATWPHFAASVLNGLDDWDSGVLWPRSGAWPDLSQSKDYQAGVRNALLRGAGIRGSETGAIRFDRNEDGALVAVLYAYLAFGWCVDDDLFFIPDHGRQLLQTDHHDVIHVECSTAGRMKTLIAHMADAGYELPSEPPDETFRWPAWMDK